MFSDQRARRFDGRQNTVTAYNYVAQLDLRFKKTSTSDQSEYSTAKQLQMLMINWY